MKNVMMKIIFLETWDPHSSMIILDMIKAYPEATYLGQFLTQYDIYLSLPTPWLLCMAWGGADSAPPP